VSNPKYNLRLSAKGLDFAIARFLLLKTNLKTNLSEYQQIKKKTRIIFIKPTIGP
jgi:hypothetical protein